ncbi:hypothetical protein D021_4080B, partial [Vibrio parahaemolyticus 10296]
FVDFDTVAYDRWAIYFQSRCFTVHLRCFTKQDIHWHINWRVVEVGVF